MNAFQIGLATFKWDPKLNKYIIRPFNFYVWPNSNLMDKSIMQFATSNVNFLIQNNFNFNKLFKEGLSYQRISDKNLILKQIAIKMNEEP
jgi:poly(A)-specific ribonuclease